jgi:tyrosyl-tRNA synthetase
MQIGGNDQTFNMLAGRTLMRQLKNKEKFVLTTKLLTDPTGKKMGKTEANMINLDEHPKEMYGKIMKWPDTLINLGFELCTLLPMEEFKKITNPRAAKAELAREIVRQYYGEAAAQAAELEFDRVFKEKKTPTKIPEKEIKESQLNILELLVKINLAPSKSEAKRLILQGGVKINGKVCADWKELVNVHKGMVVQVGKRNFAKII